MSDVERFVQSVHHWDRFGTRKLQVLDNLAKQPCGLTELASAFSQAFPGDAGAIDFVRSATAAGYDILGELGLGGMAIVLRVRNRNSERDEALKLLRPELLDEHMTKRFAKEIDCLVKLRNSAAAISLTHSEANSPSLPFPKLFEATPLATGDVPCFTMELLEGESLRERIARRGPEPLNSALEMVERIAGALRQIHDIDVVHRDVKPSNIFITSQGRVVLLDFGVVKALSSRNREASADPTLTDLQSLQAIGTLAYTAPQQLKDPHNASPSNDVYSLGCVLYFLLTGRHAFGDASTLGQAIDAHTITCGKPRLSQSTIESEGNQSRRPELPATLCEFDANDEPIKTPRRVVELFAQMTDPDEERRITSMIDVQLRVKLALGTTDFVSREAEERGLTSVQRDCLSRYLRHLRNEQVSFSKIPLVRSERYSSLETKEVFVEIALQKSEKESGNAKTTRQSETQSMGSLLAMHRKLIFLGPPGGGKTTLLKRAALAFAEGLSEEIPGWKEQFESKESQLEFAYSRRPIPGMVPIFLRLRNFAAYLLKQKGNGAEYTRPQLLSYLEHYYNQDQDLRLYEGFFEELLSKGGCAIFLDGLDEVPTSLRTSVAYSVRDFVEAYAPSDRVPLRLGLRHLAAIDGKDRAARDNLFILASRPRGYEDVATILPKSEYGLCEVKSLSLPSIRQLLGNVLRMIEPNNAQRRQDLESLFAAISNSRELTILAGNPMFCTSLALVYKSKGAQLPKRRIDVFEEIVGLLLGHWKSEDRKAIADEATDDDLEFANRDIDTAVFTRKERLSAVAYYMQHSSSRTEIADSDLITVLEKYLIEDEGKQDIEARHTARKFIRFSHERSGLFVEMEPQVYAFTHEGFREYLVAHALSNMREEELVATIIDHISDANWEQVLLLAGAHPNLAGKSRAHLLETCVAAAEQCLRNNDSKGWARRLTMAGKMANDMGDYLLPKYRQILQKHLRTAVMNSSQVLNDRIELALTLDSIDSLTDNIYLLTPLSSNKDDTRYVGVNLVSNRLYRRFLDATDYADERYWSQPFCRRIDDRDYSLADDSLKWLHDHREEGRFPKCWSDSKLGIVYRGLPVVGVSWYEANAYCEWLRINWDKLEESKSNPGIRPQRIRLPLEAEWDHVANSIFSGSAVVNWQAIANVGRVVDGTSPVGMFPQGLDMKVADWIGNAWQWQANLFDRSLRAMALRGGAFTTSSVDMAAGLRGNCPPSARSSDVGFRILVEC